MQEAAEILPAIEYQLILYDSRSFVFIAIVKSYPYNISIITQVGFQVNIFFLKLTTT